MFSMFLIITKNEFSLLRLYQFMPLNFSAAGILNDLNLKTYRDVSRVDGHKESAL